MSAADDDTPPIVIDSETKAIELKVVERLLDDVLAAGFKVSVGDEEVMTLRMSGSKFMILRSLWATDLEYLTLTGPARGVIKLVHGNDGWDVINDFSESLAQWVDPIMEFANTLDDGCQPD